MMEDRDPGGHDTIQMGKLFPTTNKKLPVRIMWELSKTVG